MGRLLFRAKIIMACLVSLVLFGVTVFILLGTYPHLAESHIPPLFAPYAGTSAVNTTSSFQTFVFNTNSISAWTTNNGGYQKPHPHNGYEHDIKVSPKDIIKRRSGWDSNLPAKYLDCDWFDGNENDFTVGCDNGWLMVPQTTYWHRVNSQTGGQGSQGTVSLSAQLTYRTYLGDPNTAKGVSVWWFCSTMWLLCNGSAASCNFVHDGANLSLKSYTVDLSSPPGTVAWTNP